MTRRTPRANGSSSSLPSGFWVIWTAVALDLVGFGIVLPILPVYAEQFGAGPATATALVSAFSAAQFVFAPLWGRLSDRIGRRPALTLALLGTAVGSLVTGLAGSVWLLFVGRIVDGASGTSYVIGQAAVADLTEPVQRPRALGLLASAFGLGFVVGPLIGSFAALGPDALPFFIAAGLAAVNAVLAWVRVPETAPPETAPRDTDNHEPLVSFRPGRRLAAARRHGVLGLIGVAFVSMVGFSGFEGTLSLLLERRFGLENSSIYGVFAAVGIALVLVQVRLVGPVSQRVSGRRGLALPLATTALGLVVLAPDGGWVSLTVALLLLVVGQGLTGPLLSAATVEQAGDSGRGEVLGLQQSAGSLGRIVGPLGAGALFGLAIPAPYLAAAALVALAAVLSWRE